MCNDGDSTCPNFCPCCKSNKQWIRHWVIDCPFINHICSKVNDKILFLYNAFYRGNLTNDVMLLIVIIIIVIVIIIIVIVIIVIVIVIIVIVIKVIVILVIVFLVQIVVIIEVFLS